MQAVNKEQDYDVVRRIHYNRPQLYAHTVGANDETCIWGRGTGKSTGRIAPWVIDKVFSMPRSRGVLVAETYLQALERTLPPVIQGWEEMGYQRDVDFVLLRKPPSDWQTPYIGPLTPQHTIFWKNGTVISLISQDRPGTSNGMSVDWIFGDETKLLNKQRLDEELLPTNRGNERYFKGIPGHHATLWTTDMPTTPGAKWLIEKEQQMDKEQIRLILAVRVEMFKAYQAKNLKKYNRLIKLWDELRSSAVLFSEASTLENIEVLGVGFIRRMKRTLPDLAFRTSILNQRITQIENGFYALLDEEEHCYNDVNYNFVDNLGLYLPNNNEQLTWRKDNDLDPSRPLSIALDYNASINPLVVGQRFGKYLKFQNTFYVTHPQRLKDVIKSFTKYYEGYPNKDLIYHYDHTAVGTNASSDISYADEVRELLESNGWSVTMNFIGNALSHYTRYLMWGYALAGDDDRFLKPRFNKNNTHYLVLSMQNAEVYQSGQEYKKKKTDERKKEIDQRETTHFSDAGDTLLVGENAAYLQGVGVKLETIFLK
jgi:hypothetical protein